MGEVEQQAFEVYLPQTQEICRKTAQQELTREGRLASAFSHDPTSLKGGGFGDGAGVSGATGHSEEGRVHVVEGGHRTEEDSTSRNVDPCPCRGGGPGRGLRGQWARNWFAISGRASLVATMPQTPEEESVCHLCPHSLGI